jgi:multisubunit Na+/H+ antiporter MnhB subunit
MIEFLLKITGIIVFAVIAGWLGVEYETVEAIAAILVGAVVLWLAARSAYRDACRRQRRPGKNLETRNALSKAHDAASSSLSATNR